MFRRREDHAGSLDARAGTARRSVGPRLGHRARPAAVPRGDANAQATNLIEDVAGLPYFLSATHRDWPFLRLSGQLLREHAPTRFDELLNRRSLMRRIGMFELARHRERGRTVLIDEGPVLIAYHLFVYSTADATGPDLEIGSRHSSRCRIGSSTSRPTWATLAARARAWLDRRRQLAGLPVESVTAWLEGPWTSSTG